MELIYVTIVDVALLVIPSVARLSFHHISRRKYLIIYLNYSLSGLHTQSRKPFIIFLKKDPLI